MISRLRVGAVGAVAVLLLGCVGAPDACVHAESGEVCASTKERAEEVGRRLDAFSVRIREILPQLREGGLEVWLQPRPQVFWFAPVGEHVAAFTNHWNGRIHLAEESAYADVELAHEMVHALLGDGWDGLPPTLEEGVCDQVSARIATDGADLRADRFLLAMAAADGPSIRLRVETPGGWSEQTANATFRRDDDFRLVDAFSRDGAQVRPIFGERERSLWYGLGFVAAGRLLDRLGPAGLRDLCLRAEDLDDAEASVLFADAAGLGAESAGWREAIEEQLLPADRVALAAGLASLLAREAVDILTVREDAAPVWAEVEAARPRMRIGRVSEFVELVDLPEFREAVEMLLEPSRVARAEVR